MPFARTNYQWKIFFRQQITLERAFFLFSNFFFLLLRECHHVSVIRCHKKIEMQICSLKEKAWHIILYSLNKKRFKRDAEKYNISDAVKVLNSSVILIFTILFILLSILLLLLLLLLFREIRYCTCRSSYSCINFNPYVETGSGKMSPRFLKSVEIILWEKYIFYSFFFFFKGGRIGSKNEKMDFPAQFRNLSREELRWKLSLFNYVNLMNQQCYKG